ncbi:MAG: class I adenylate-forming enzyme family protein [Bacillota bacterium]
MNKKIWHNSYPSFVPPEIEIEKISLGEIMHRTAERFAKKTVFIFLGSDMSYQELDQHSNRFANVLRKLGIEKGDRVATLLPNCPQMIFGYHGIWRTGAVVVPCNPTYTDSELEYQLNNSGATVLLTIDALSPRMLALRPKTKVKTIITTHLNDYLPPSIKEKVPSVPFQRDIDHYELLNLMGSEPCEYNPTYAAWDETSMIIYTGGTTGLPKGAVLTVGNNSSAAQITRAWYANLDENEVSLGVFPFFHIGGFNGALNSTLSKGWTMVLMPKPDVKEMFELIMKYRISMVAAVPTLLIQMIQLPEWKTADKTFIKYFLSGAAPVPAAVIDKLSKDTGCGMVEQAGMTETSGINNIVPVTGPFKPGSCGVPPSNMETRIVDIETGEREMPVGEDGEILHRGPHVMKEYYNKPEETATALRNGWLYTGDIGHMDEDGYLYIVDRKKDMILSGGNNIYPRDIDEVLLKHPKISQVCTVGVPDEQMGEKVKAFVILKPGETATFEELTAYCKTHLARYKIPKAYEFVDNLPMNAAGKTLRYILRQQEMEKASK